jgi:hypothetical protein
MAFNVFVLLGYFAKKKKPHWVLVRDPRLSLNGLSRMLRPSLQTLKHLRVGILFNEWDSTDPLSGLTSEIEEIRTINQTPNRRNVTAPWDPQQHPICYPIRSPRINLSSLCHERYEVPGKRSGVQSMTRIMRVLSILEQGQRASSVFNTLCEKPFRGTRYSFVEFYKRNLNDKKVAAMSKS